MNTTAVARIVNCMHRVETEKKSRNAEEHVFKVGVEYGDVCIEYKRAEHGVECQNRGLPSHAIRDVQHHVLMKQPLQDGLIVPKR